MRLHTTAREREVRQRWSAGNWLAATVIAAGVVSVVAILIGTLSTDRSDEVWLELAKAGVQILAVGLIGSAVAAAWKYHEQERDRERRIHEQQLAVFRQVVESYNEVKAIRRTLQSLGLRSLTGTLIDVQVRGFREQMQRLNVVQLSFEALKREVPETDIFRSDTSAITKELSDIEHFLNDVLKVWEDRGSLLDAGSGGTAVSKGLNDLIVYAPFKKGVVDHRREITRLIHKHLCGPLSESTNQELKQLDAEEDKRFGSPPRENVGPGRATR